MSFSGVFKKTLSGMIRAIQKALMVVFLTLIYFAGCGVTLFFMALFNRALIYGGSKKRGSSWVEAEDYSAGIKESLRQS